MTSPNELDQFYKEMKRVEKKEVGMNSKTQIDRLLRPGSMYFNLNPYAVMDVDPDSSVDEMKRKFRKLSLLLHPDKNRDDADRAQQAFDTLAKAWKLLEDDGSRENCYQIVMQAKNKVFDFIKNRKRQLANEGKTLQVEEETDPERFNHALYVYTTKIFADLELKRKNLANREMDERKRQRDIEEDEREKLLAEAEWKKKFEDTRQTRVNSWQKFKKRIKDFNSSDSDGGDSSSGDNSDASAENASKKWKKDAKAHATISTVKIPKYPNTPHAKQNSHDPPSVVINIPSKVYAAAAAAAALYTPPPPPPPPPFPILTPLSAPIPPSSTTSKLLEPPPPPQKTESVDLQVGNCYNVFASNVCHPDNKKKKKFIRTFKPPKHKMETR